jgi:hypothetical protein
MPGEDRQCWYWNIVLARTVVVIQEELKMVKEVTEQEFSSGQEIMR